MATFAHTLRGSSAIEGISQAWSLGVEVCFYAFVPLLALVLRRRSGAAALSPSRRGWLRNQQVLLSLGLIALGTLWRFGVALAKPSWGGSAIYWLPTYLDIFAGGMLMAAVKSGRPLPQAVYDESAGVEAISILVDNWMQRVGTQAKEGGHD